MLNSHEIFNESESLSYKVLKPISRFLERRGRRMLDKYHINVKGLESIDPAQSYIFASVHINNYVTLAQIPLDALIIRQMIEDQLKQKLFIAAQSDVEKIDPTIARFFPIKMINPILRRSTRLREAAHDSVDVLSIHKNSGNVAFFKSAKRMFEQSSTKPIRSSLLIFPEGEWHTAYDPNLLLGEGILLLAKQNSVPIIPVGIKGLYDKNNKNIQVTFGTPTLNLDINQIRQSFNMLME